MSTTMRQHRYACNETRRQVSAGSQFLRVRLDRAKQHAGAFMTTAVPKGTTITGISSQQLSHEREGTGSVAGVAAIVTASPDHGEHIISYLQGVLRRVRDAQRPHCLTSLLLAEQRSDSAEDVSQSEVLADQSTDNLVRYRDDLRRALADGQRALDAVEHELGERGEA